MEVSESVDCVLVGDDSAVFRGLVSDILVKKQIAQSVIPCSSGVELLSVAAERLHKGLPIRLAVLDILMQPLDGMATALSLRAIEKGFHLPTPIPLLFLSAVRSDDTLRRFIAKCQPALYLNKAADSTPEKLGDRIEKVVVYLLQARGPVLASR